jgi:hypothetical protein
MLQRDVRSLWTGDWEISSLRQGKRKWQSRWGNKTHCGAENGARKYDNSGYFQPVGFVISLTCNYHVLLFKNKKVILFPIKCDKITQTE